LEQDVLAHLLSGELGLSLEVCTPVLKVSGLHGVRGGDIEERYRRGNESECVFVVVRIIASEQWSTAREKS
jgi:hypothetical protein